jgi:hypothetical protein
MIGLTYGKRLSTRQQQKQNYIFFRKFDFLERTKKNVGSSKMNDKSFPLI